MQRLCLIGVVFFASIPRASAQPEVKPKDGKLIVAATVSPTPIPVPAMKYLLLPELRDRQPGNQVQAFYKCFMLQHRFYHDKASVEEREKLSSAPLAQLIGEKRLIEYGGSSLRRADYAARLTSVDWELLNQFKVDGIGLLLPDISELRILGEALRVRLRGEIARKEYAAAIRTAQTMLGLAAAFNEHPTLIGQLVGLAIANMALGTLEELQQQPGAPNLFWAFADLPTPFIDLRKGMQGERLWLPEDYLLLRKAEPIPEAILKKRIKELGEWLKLETGAKKITPAAEYYAKRANDPTTVAAMKERLARLGHKPAALDKLSNLQIAMMEDFAVYEEYRDSTMKWANLPYWRLPVDFTARKQPEGILPELTPAVIKVIQARARFQQRLGLVQTVEAIRAYAAENEGNLPASLEAIKLPLPVDPVTGKAFRYEVKDGKAILRGTPPADRKTDYSFNRVYEVTIRK